MENIATLAGGCFWGMEALFRKIPGVLDTEVGYCGGDASTAAYTLVKTGDTGHAEALQIKFDPGVVSYAQILDFFFRVHDPSTKNRQGGDVGTQYRSVIFFHDDEQRAQAQTMIETVEKSGAWGAKISTELVPVSKFFPAEAYHQDYLEKNPDGYTCHFVRKLPSFIA